MKFKTRRLQALFQRLTGRSWEDVSPRLEDFLRALMDEWTGGIPPGFNNLVPPTIQAGVAGSSGAEGSGWMSASALVPIETGAPTQATGAVAAEGTGTALMRASATIKQGIVTTKGDLLGFDGTLGVPARVPVSLNDGEVIISDSTEDLGLRWGQIDGRALSGPARILFNTGALDLRHFRRRKFLGLVYDNNRSRAGALNVGARKVF